MYAVEADSQQFIPDLCSLLFVYVINREGGGQRRRKRPRPLRGCLCNQQGGGRSKEREEAPSGETLIHFHVINTLRQSGNNSSVAIWLVVAPGPTDVRDYLVGSGTRPHRRGYLVGSGTRPHRRDSIIFQCSHCSNTWQCFEWIYIYACIHVYTASL